MSGPLWLTTGIVIGAVSVAALTLTDPALIGPVSLAGQPLTAPPVALPMAAQTALPPTRFAIPIGGQSVGGEGGSFACVEWTIAIPPGLVPNGSTLHCDALDPVAAPGAPGGFQLLRRAVDIHLYDEAGHPVTAFTRLIMVCAPYTESQLIAAHGMADHLVIQTAPMDAQGWSALPTTSISSAHRACAMVDHLTLFDLSVRAPEAVTPAAYVPTSDLAASPARPTSAGIPYTVRAGATLFGIARRFGLTVSALADANGMSGTTIYPGQILTIPGVEAGTSAAAPALASAAVTGAGLNHLGAEKVVLADYMMWYGPGVFDGSHTWDVPAAGPYDSDSMDTIRRHVALAQQACLDGFSAHWYGPTDPTTTHNFDQLLRASAGTNLRHAIVILTNILPDATEQMLIDAVNYAIANWSQSQNYLHLGGRPVVIFTDMARPWGSQAEALTGWARIRAATDPDHKTIWMAEGLTTAYNPLFDGLYVYRIDHRDYPKSWLKQPRWAAALHALEKGANSLPLGGGLYFADTIAPGFDDTRSNTLPGDLRLDTPHFARDRRDGGYYADTFAATAQTGGDFLLVKSFNEWVEGTELEPGKTYADLYLNLTCQYANEYRSR